MSRRSLFVKRKTLYSTRKTTKKTIARKAARKSADYVYDEESEDDFTDVPQHIRLSLEYVATAQGLLIFIETGGAIAIVVLYVLMVRYLTDEWYAHGSFLVAFTYALNDLLIIIASLSSPSTQMHIPRTVFYVLYQCLAGFGYGLTGALLYMFGRGGPLPYAAAAGLTGLGVALVHFVHTIINVLIVVSLEPD